MTNFPTTAEEFYTLRDDRTNRCTVNRDYQNATCAVRISPAAVSTYAGQVALVVATNLLSRWSRKVTIMVPESGVHPCLGQLTGDLCGAILAQMSDADPFGDFRMVDDGECCHQITLRIGEEEGAPAPKTVFINASGWLASISTGQPIPLEPSEDMNCLGAIAAACFGVSQMFKFAIGVPPSRYLRDGIFDMFRLNWSSDASQALWPNRLSMGNLLMVGAGSVATAVAYCMRLANVSGSITVIDRDLVQVENFNRSPIFGCRTFGLPKVDAVAEFMAGSALAVTPVLAWWNEFVKERKRSSFDFDVWLPLANEFGVRHAIQHNIPPLMIHASTTSNWGVNYGRHIPGRDDCLADRFPSEVAVESLVCATSKVELSGVSADAALPFVSLFAGLLAASDLVRAQLPGYPQTPNFALLDWYGPIDVQAWDRKPRAGCICQEQDWNFHNQYNSSTAYWSVFNLL